MKTAQNKEKGQLMRKNSPLERIWNGVWRENPTFVLFLGMCATLAVTTSARNGFAMGVSTAAVLVLSNVAISALRRVIPDSVRMPAYIVIVVSFVTVAELLMHAYTPSLYKALGIYIPLIVVNCIILGRAEAFASKNAVIPSLFDGLGMGLGFTGALTLIGLLRELLGAGTVFGIRVLGDWYTPVSVFVLAPGAFFVLAGIAALRNARRAKKHPEKQESPTCGGSCRLCPGGCAGKADRGVQKSSESSKGEEKEA